MQDDISLAYAWGWILPVPSIAFVLIFALVWYLSERRTWFARRLKPTEGRLIEAFVSAGEIQRPGRRDNPAMYLPRGRYGTPSMASPFPARRFRFRSTATAARPMLWRSSRANAPATR